MAYQIIRSSDSLSANMAEGYGRYTPADRKKFYLYSRGSLEETKSWLRKLIRRKVLSVSNATEYKAIVDKLGPKLNAFINSTKAWRPNFQFLFSNFNVPWTVTLFYHLARSAFKISSKRHFSVQQGILNSWIICRHGMLSHSVGSTWWVHRVHDHRWF